MEEAISLSMVSNTTTLNGLVVGDGCSDYNSSNSNSPPRGSNNHKRKHISTTSSENGLVLGDGCSDYHDSNDNHCKRQRSSTTSSKYKGVVPQAKGRWGAQFYKARKRTWIGTFESESDAAMAYDTVALMIIGSDDHIQRNFPVTTITSWETEFQELLTLEEVLAMLKDGSYRTKLCEFASSCSSLKQDKNLTTGSSNNGTLTYRRLFQKELTSSDVGKLNRLVIPKRYAEKYFPELNIDEKKAQAGVIEEIQLTISDREMKRWEFRYCFWTSSQSYVFTRGWSRFVKEKKLEAKDVVTFYWCECREDNKAFCMIDITSKGDVSGRDRVDLQLGIGQATVNESRPPSDKAIQVWQNKEDSVVPKEVAPPQPVEEKKTLRLFGVNIS